MLYPNHNNNKTISASLKNVLLTWLAAGFRSSPRWWRCQPSAAVRAAIKQPGRLNLQINLHYEGQELIVLFVLCQGCHVLPKGDRAGQVLIDCRRTLCLQRQLPAVPIPEVPPAGQGTPCRVTAPTVMSPTQGAGRHRPEMKIKKIIKKKMPL